MIPTDFRLDYVVAPLLERLEGTRRSHSDPEAARAAFARIAEEHLLATVAEAEEYVDADEIEHHARFLREEIYSTLLPRYGRMAAVMTADEEHGYGLGALVKPVGRLALVAVALVVFLVLARFMYSPVTWPLLLLDLSLPFWPDLVAALRRRQYRRELESLLNDIGRIQDQAAAFVRPQDELDPRIPMEEPGTTPTRGGRTPQAEEAS